MTPRTTRSLALGREGQVLPIIVIFLVALLSLGALAFDLGQIFAARTEAQRAADAIALAAASAFIGSPSSSSVADAKARAKEKAAQNQVLEVALDTATVSESTDAWQSPEVTIEILEDSMMVRASVRRTGIGLWLGKFFGEDLATVAGAASAEAAVPGASGCTIPFAIPVDPSAPMEFGQLMVLKAADSATVAGADPFFAPFATEGDADVAAEDDCVVVAAGDEQTLAALDRDGPTARAVHSRLDRDPTVFWNERDGRLWRGGTRLADYVSTPRAMRVPTFDRNELAQSGEGTFTITGFAYFFLETGPEPAYNSPTNQLEITGRFLFPAPDGAGSASPYSRALRLVR